MTASVAVLRHQRHGSDGRDLGDVVALWCPGCDSLHMPCVRPGVDERPVWTWDGDLERPTIQPSILVTWSWQVDGVREERRCHSYVTAGEWRFLSDCTHALAGQTVPLPALPDWITE